MNMYRFFFVLAISLMTSAAAQARTLKVYAGKLQNYFDTYDLVHEYDLKLTGAINGTDVKLLREWATAARTLDLSECRIVAGGEAYFDEYTTEDDVIGSYMFADKEFERLVLPKNLKKIGDYAIPLCGDEMELPPTLEWLGDHAFTDNIFKKLHLPASLTHIGNGALTGNLFMSEMTIDENNPEFVIEDGYLYTRNHTRLLAFVAPIDSIAPSFTIRPEVVTIDDRAFNGHYCDRITLNEGLEYIGAAAFRYAMVKFSTSQHTLIIPNSVKYIGELAFSDCRVDSIIISDSIEEIQPRTFEQCFLYYVHLPAKLKSVGYSGLSNNLLFDLVLPEGLETIGEYAFSQARTRKLVIPSSVRNIAPKAFWNVSCDTLEIKAPLDSIPNACFYGCQMLKKLILPPTIKRIGSGAFYACYRLEDCKLPDGLEEIGGEALSGADDMKVWHIPASVRKIEFGAFFVPNFSAHDIYMYSKEPPAETDPKAFWEPREWMSWNMAESVLYVPEGSIGNYQQEPWSRFGTIKEFTPTGIHSPRINGKQSYERSFDLHGRPVSKNSRGLRIVITPNGPVKRI